MESQIARIKLKLSIAKKIDSKREVFGASDHKYRLGTPLSEEEIVSFEKAHSITLPECYRVFLKRIGNGGVSYRKSAAGPFYGIYPLGGDVDELVENPKRVLKNKVIISPKHTEKELKSMFSIFENLDEMSDEEYDLATEKIFSGILPIGSQGCSCLHAILLNGEYKGRVVNLDLNMEIPHFSYEDNFLDWYERWLDEVISKYLISDRPTWFGYEKRKSKSITSSEQLKAIYKENSKFSFRKKLKQLFRINL